MISSIPENHLGCCVYNCEQEQDRPWPRRVDQAATVNRRQQLTIPGWCFAGGWEGWRFQTRGASEGFPSSPMTLLVLLKLSPGNKNHKGESHLYLLIGKSGLEVDIRFEQQLYGPTFMTVRPQRRWREWPCLLDISLNAKCLRHQEFFGFQEL